MSFVVAALYHFADLPDPAGLVVDLQARCQAAQVQGTLLVASEGVNGTIAGSRESIDATLHYLRSVPGLEQLEHKESFCDTAPFLRLKVKQRAEIVTMGVDTVRPADRVGTYVEPEDWNELIAQDDVVLIDTRNDFEVRVGSFEGAINPNTVSFSEFPAYVASNLPPSKHKRVAMFCTGGIRCEKASSHLLDQGYEEVYHLKGGILRYLEKIPAAHSKWRGECFVFDRRVSVVHGLGVGSYELCHGCQSPLSPEQRAHPLFVQGVACEYCAETLSSERRKALEMRLQQIHLASERGEDHLGVDEEELRRRRQVKEQAKEQLKEQARRDRLARDSRSEPSV